jgi:hypothetical protein
MAPPLPSVSVDEAGVWCQDAPNRRWGIGWDEIVRLTIVKVDAITSVDTSVELDFESGHSIELNSAFPGFSSAVMSILKRLPGVAADWPAQVEALRPGGRPVVLWQRRS